VAYGDSVGQHWSKMRVFFEETLFNANFVLVFYSKHLHMEYF